MPAINSLLSSLRMGFGQEPALRLFATSFIWNCKSRKQQTEFSPDAPTIVVMHLFYAINPFIKLHKYF